MKKFFSKLITSAAILATALFGTVASTQAQFNTPSPTVGFTVTTNTPATNGYYNIWTNNAKIANVTMVGGGGFGYINIYDSSTTNSTYTNAAYATLTTYTSNVVSTFISPLTGVTNIQTNLMLVEATVTNLAATNPLPYRTFAVAPNALASYNVNMLNSKGIGFYASTNLTVIVTFRQ